MRVLVAVASKYGATAELGQAIADTLAEAAVDTTFARLEHNPPADGYDAVVVGSAVYAGHWLKAAREWVERNGQQLAAVPVWLFSSGPVGDPPMPGEETLNLAEISASTGALGHGYFSGKLERSGLKFTDKAIAAALRVPDGDFRDFDAVRVWADGIAQTLRQPAA